MGKTGIPTEGGRLNNMQYRELLQRLDRMDRDISRLKEALEAQQPIKRGPGRPKTNGAQQKTN